MNTYNDNYNDNDNTPEDSEENTSINGISIFGMLASSDNYANIMCESAKVFGGMNNFMEAVTSSSDLNSKTRLSDSFATVSVLGATANKFGEYKFTFEMCKAFMHSEREYQRFFNEEEETALATLLGNSIVGMALSFKKK